MCRGDDLAQGFLAGDPRVGWEAGCSTKRRLGGGSWNRGESGGGGRGMAGRMQGIVGSGEGRRERGGENGLWRGRQRGSVEEEGRWSNFPAATVAAACGGGG